MANTVLFFLLKNKTSLKNQQTKKQVNPTKPNEGTRTTKKKIHT